MIIANGRINVENADLSRDFRDGLRVRGGLISFYTGSQSSIDFNRNLRLLDNFDNPSHAVIYDPRYIFIAQEALGKESEAYKTEVGL